MGDKRASLHRMLQAAAEQDSSITGSLSKDFASENAKVLDSLGKDQKLTLPDITRTLETGFTLGGFFCEAGWYPAATIVHRSCLASIKKLSPLEGSYLFCKLETISKLLHSLSSFCCFQEATALAAELQQCLLSTNPPLTPQTYPNLAAIYNELSSHSFMKSQYHESYKWAMKAVQLLVPSNPPKVTIDCYVRPARLVLSKESSPKLKFSFDRRSVLPKESMGQT